MFKKLLSSSQSDPYAAEMKAFRSADLANPPPDGAILFVGSSSIRLWETLAQDFAPMPVINRGFGGAFIAAINRHFKTVAAPCRPRLIVFYAGDNDLERHGAARVIADFEHFMRLKSAKFGALPVCFISIKPAPARARYAEARREANETIRARAFGRADLIYADIETPMARHPDIDALFLTDGIHLSPAGYELWAASIKPILAPYLAS